MCTNNITINFPRLFISIKIPGTIPQIVYVCISSISPNPVVLSHDISSVGLNISSLEV